MQIFLIMFSDNERTSGAACLLAQGLFSWRCLFPIEEISKMV